MNRDQLFDAMVNRKPVYINGRRHYINSLQMVDGSGFCFNLGLSTGVKDYTVFYRCEKPDVVRNLSHSSYRIEIC